MKPDGGHAFPNITPDMNVDGGPGMTLRDYFAAKALPQVMHTQLRMALAGQSFEGSPEEKAAKAAYEIADAMLAEREKGNQMSARPGVAPV